MNLTPSDRERFFEKVEAGDPDECWEWTAATTSGGYGVFRLDGKALTAHRLSYIIENEDPGELYVLHSCDNPPCVNPNHLRAGTQSENMIEASERGRLDDRNTIRGAKHPQAKLTEDYVREIRERYAEGGVYHKELADEFGVERSVVTNAVNRKTWRHVE